MKGVILDNSGHYPERYNRVSRKTEEERDIFEEVQEDLSATDFGTHYLRRERVSIRFNKETEIEAR